MQHLSTGSIVCPRSLHRALSPNVCLPECMPCVEGSEGEAPPSVALSLVLIPPVSRSRGAAGS